MQTIKITCLLFVALLPSIIQGFESSTSAEDEYGDNEDFDKPILDARIRVDAIMENGGLINNVFKPLKFLGFGGYSVNYKGELGEEKKIVAMKMSSISMLEGYASDEYYMYTYLWAIDNATVEDYGIPAVYYFCADWEGFSLLAITLLDPQFTELTKTPIRLKDLDILIIIREFVRITKYIHLHGVCHADFHLGNLMFRKNNGFIIDFNWSHQAEGQIKPDSDCRKEDWQRFLIKLCPFCEIAVDEKNHNNTVRNIAKLEKNNVLRYILLHFARHAFKAEPINYNEMHRIITEMIRRVYVSEPALVSWLTPAQRDEAKAEWLRHTMPAIESIAEPGTEFIYPEPKLDYFHNFK